MARVVSALDGNGSVILQRTFGAAEGLSSLRTLNALFSSVASYAQRTAGFALRHVRSADCRVLFLSVEDVLLVLVTGDLCTREATLRSYLELVHQSAVMLLGAEAWDERPLSIRQRDLRVLVPIVDSIFQNEHPPVGLALRGVEMHSLGGATAQAQVEQAVDSLAEAAGVDVALLFLNGRVCYATTSGWALPATELQLLSAIVHNIPQAATCEMPITLPTTAPTRSIRMLKTSICSNTELVLLSTTSDPTLEHAVELAEQHLAPVTSVFLEASHLTHPCWLATVHLDPCAQACILVRRDTNQVWLYDQEPATSGTDKVEVPLLDSSTSNSWSPSEQLRGLVALAHTFDPCSRHAAAGSPTVPVSSAASLDTTAKPRELLGFDFPRHHAPVELQMVTAKSRLTAFVHEEVEVYLSTPKSTSPGSAKGLVQSVAVSLREAIEME